MLLFLFLDSSVHMHGPLSMCFCSKQPVNPSVTYGDSDIQPKTALVVAKCCSPFRTVHTSLLELTVNAKHCFSVGRRITCRSRFSDHSGCIFEPVNIFVNHFQLQGLFKQLFQFWPNFSFRPYKNI